MPDHTATDRRQARVERRLRFLLRGSAFFNPENRDVVRWALADEDAIPVALATVGAQHCAGPDGAIDWDKFFTRLLELLPIILQLLSLFMATATPTET